MKRSIKVISTLLLAIMLVTSIATTAFAAVNLNTTISNIEKQNLNGNAAIDWILTHTQYNHKFKGYSNISTQATARYVRKNPIEAIIGDLDNSFVKVWGGELERNN